MPTDDVVLKRCCFVQDVACWALLAVLGVFALVTPFIEVGMPGVIVLVVTIFVAMVASMVVMLAECLSPRRHHF